RFNLIRIGHGFQLISFRDMDLIFVLVPIASLNLKRLFSVPISVGNIGIPVQDIGCEQYSTPAYGSIIAGLEIHLFPEYDFFPIILEFVRIYLYIIDVA